MDKDMVTVEIKEGTREYLYRLVELGVIQGPLGAMEPPPEIQHIIEALHHVMAGGKSEIVVREAGDPTVVNELNKRFNTITEGGWR